MVKYEQCSDPCLRDGFWECPVCKNTFYGGGTALHTSDCPRDHAAFGYDGLTYWYTQAEKARWEADLKERGFYACPGDMSPALSRHLLKSAIAGREISQEEVVEITTQYINSIDPAHLPVALKSLEAALAS